MQSFPSLKRPAGAALLLLMLSSDLGVARQQPDAKNFPFPEKLSYRIEWRMVMAGSAVVELSRSGQNWQTTLNVESAGLVSRLLRVKDTYRVIGTDHFCGINSSLEAQEGKRHTSTTMLFDNSRHKLAYSERDLIKNTSNQHEIDIAPCTYEISGALQSLRQLKLETGRVITLPLTNGKKMVTAKIEALGADKITLNGKNYPTIRYEAFVFDNVLYRRKGRLFVWITDDSEHLPVQLQFQMGFPIGNVTVSLEKQETS
ncbi:MAG TPA: DUF3108 domain-containing protein [Bryobacteraceae bacterium]|nr:DUF3108 domain-containing protein [Bryobacteraceae bacterium]